MEKVYGPVSRALDGRSYGDVQSVARVCPEAGQGGRVGVRIRQIIIFQIALPARGVSLRRRLNYLATKHTEIEYLPLVDRSSRDRLRQSTIRSRCRGGGDVREKMKKGGL